MTQINFSEEVINLPIFATTPKMSSLICHNRSWLFAQLKSGLFVEGVHTVLLSTSKRRWNVPLVVDRLVNIDDEAAHQRAIARWQERLPSNWPVAKAPKTLA